nr:hypothetical protein [uncultured Desulfuromusa sp.]
MPTDINTTKTRLHRLLQSATPNTEPPKTNKTIPTLLIICLIGTMLPIQIMTTFFSLSFATIALLSLALSWTNRTKIAKRTGTLILALTAVSVMSGCSPAFTFLQPPEMINFAHEHDLEYHSMRKIGMFGLEDATISACQAESNIKTILATQIDKGHGLISITIITIAGKA